MDKLNKKDWLQGLILMAINSTTVIKDSVKRHEYALKVSEETTEIILNQFNSFGSNNKYYGNKCIVDSCLHNSSKKCYYPTNEKWRKIIEDAMQCPFLKYNIE